ncbi:bkdB [Symbiodinium natans]|uniref:BkdB protein n=1 Tax=Symbiodinium natans TaxID=878477 RepID=A0A812Q4N5_9DINO|nr:bkdB [Symbiodinium natans]
MAHYAVARLAFLGVLCVALGDSNACLSSIQVRDGFISDAEAQTLLKDFEVTESPQLLWGHTDIQLRLKEVLGGAKPKFNASANFIPAIRRMGSVGMHQDHGDSHSLRGTQRVKVNGTSGTVYLESAPDGGSVGWMTFVDPDTDAVLKRVEAFAKRFISWDNRACLHGFDARGDTLRHLLGPVALDANSDLFRVAGEPGPAPPPPPPPKACRSWCWLLQPRVKVFHFVKECQGCVSPTLTQTKEQPIRRANASEHADPVHFMQTSSQSRQSREEL